MTVEVPGRGQFRAEDQHLRAGKAVGAYKGLATVESSFRDRKDVIEMHPVYHKTDPRIEAHLLVATLALFLKRTVEHQLVKTLPELSGTHALAGMRSVARAELDRAGPITRRVAAGGRTSRRVMKPLNIRDLRPPTGERLSGRDPPKGHCGDKL